MKRRIKSVLGIAALALSFVAPQGANAQNNSQPMAPVVADNSVTPPTLPTDMDPNSPLAKIIQLLQSGVAESAILADIKNSTVPFDVSAADLIYLNDLGTPSDVETALMQRDQELGFHAAAQAPQAPPPVQTQEPQDVTEDYFYGALAPYGTWINMPGYGLCWQPCAANYNPDWTPYGTLGQWVYTDYGWYWLSGYSWGWSVFHYGRWFHDPNRGWCWWPSTVWAPSWVFWRYSGNFCGWAPLPPHCYYSEEAGLVYNGAQIASGYDFGIGANLFNFVPMAKLCDSNVERYRLSAAQSAQVFAQSEVLVAINSNDRIIVNDGIPVIKIAAAGGGGMRSFTIQPVESVAVPGVRGEQLSSDGESLAIHRPYFASGVSSSLRQGIRPDPAQAQPVVHQPPTFIVNENPLSYPSASNPGDNVIYVDSAAQNVPPIPTVTTAGPQDNDYAAPAPSPVASGASYWSVSAEAPEPIDTASAYGPPRLRSHEHSEEHVREPADHHEFNPPDEGSRPSEHQESPTGQPVNKNFDSQYSTPTSTDTSSHSHSPGSGDPGHGGSGGSDSSGHDDHHGH